MGWTTRTAVLKKPSVHDLHHIIQVGSPSNLQDVLQGFTEVDINSTVCGATAISLALYRDKLDVFKCILQFPFVRHQLDVNKVSKDDKQRREPPLVTACRIGNQEAVTLLLAHPTIDLEACDDFAHTALWMATSHRRTDITLTLIQHGASVNPSLKWTHAPVFFATKYSSSRTQIAGLLVEHGASVRLDGGPSLLYCAIVQGNLHMAEMLVNAGYPVSHDDKIRQEMKSGTLTRNPNLITWLERELHQPPSLQRQCRAAVRDQLILVSRGCHFKDYVDVLPLPKSLIAYVALADSNNTLCMQST